MASVLLELDLPRDWKEFQMPTVLHDRPQDLLDQLDQDGKLSKREKREPKR